MTIKHPPEFCEITVRNGNDLTFTAKKWAAETAKPLEWVVRSPDETEMHREAWVGDLSYTATGYGGETGWEGPFRIGLDDGTATAWSGNLFARITIEEGPVVIDKTDANEVSITLAGLGAEGDRFSHYEVELAGVVEFPITVKANSTKAHEMKIVIRGIE